MSSSSIRHSLRSFFSLHEGRASYEIIRKRIESGARLDGIHACLLILAMLIASIGLNVDSTEAIIGAMLICPIMGNVLAMAFGVATIDYRLLRSAFARLLIEVVVCLATSTLYFVISPISDTTSELLTNTSPTVWDLLIAFAGGLAGGIGNSRKQEPATLIAGVAVATALMPPLCAAGYGIAMRNPGDFALALYEFSINAVFIAFGAELVLMWIHVPLLADLNGDGIVTPEERREALRHSSSLRRRLVVGTLAFAIPCVVFSMGVVRQTRANNGGELFEVSDTYDVETTTKDLEAVCPGFSSYHVSLQDSYDSKNETLVEQIVATISTSKELDEVTKESLTNLVQVHVPNVNEVLFEHD